MERGTRELDSTDKIVAILTAILVLGAIAIRLYVLYFPFSFYSYLVPPGGDAANHLVSIKNAGAWQFSSGYPPFFHLLAYYFSQLFFGGNLVEGLKWLTPAMVVLPSIAVYIFLKKNFSTRAAIFGFFIAIFTANYGLIAYADGNYPNILAAGFFMPIALSYIVKAFSEQRRKNIFYALVFLSLTILTHHFTTALFILIAITFLLTMAIYNAFRGKSTKSIKIISLLIGLLVLVAVGIYLSPAKEMFVNAYNNFKTSGTFFGDPSFIQPIEQAEYPFQVGFLPWFFGLAGIIFLLTKLNRAESEKKTFPAILLILVWFFVLFAFSRTSASGLPGRVARETGIPLILAAAVMLSSFVEMCSHKLQRNLVYGVFGFFVAINLIQVNAGSFRAPDFFNNMIWFDSADLAKANEMNKISEIKRLFTNNSTPYLKFFLDKDLIPIGLEAVKTPRDLAVAAQTYDVGYLYLGKKTASLPNEDVYPEFQNFTKLYKAIESACQQACTAKKTFSDGSVLYQIKSVKAVESATSSSSTKH